MPTYTITDKDGVVVALRQADCSRAALQADLDCTAKLWRSDQLPLSLRGCPHCGSSNEIWISREQLQRRCSDCGKRYRLSKRRFVALPELDPAWTTTQKVQVLHGAGLSAIKIGEILGLSRQRVYKHLEKLK